MVRKVAALGVVYLLLASAVALAAPVNKDADEAAVTLTDVSLQLLPAEIANGEGHDGIGDR